MSPEGNRVSPDEARIRRYERLLEDRDTGKRKLLTWIRLILMAPTQGRGVTRASEREEVLRDQVRNFRAVHPKDQK